MLKIGGTALIGLICAGNALAADPYNPAAAATPLLAQGRPDDAMRGLEARVGTNPFDAVSMNNLAAVKASRQDWYGAAELLVRAQRLAPDNGVIAGNLDQLNQYLASRAAPGKVSSSTPPEGAVWPEPPQLWDQAVRQQVSAVSRTQGSDTAPVLRTIRHHRRHRLQTNPAAAYPVSPVVNSSASPSLVPANPAPTNPIIVGQ